jgi:hypothetical protein
MWTAVAGRSGDTAFLSEARPLPNAAWRYAFRRSPNARGCGSTALGSQQILALHGIADLDVQFLDHAVRRRMPQCAGS